jgi:antitoxin CcdA
MDAPGGWWGEARMRPVPGLVKAAQDDGSVDKYSGHVYIYAHKYVHWRCFMPDVPSLASLLGPDAEAAPKRATNVSLNSRLLEEARALGINISRAAEQGLARQVAETRAKAWKEENRTTLESWNAYIEEHGLPLASFRQF